jgi:SAM-dependent methyltransferase
MIDRDNSKKIKQAWPTKKAMEQVYSQKLWGQNESEFYSGEGSHRPEIVAPYIEAVIAFLMSFKKPLVVCDLGCGDFNVGKYLVKYTAHYHAIDIVEDLISYNKAVFKEKNLEFHCLDIAVDELPNGDCMLLRQVLQHLSNAEILAILKKFSIFKYVILTEHLPQGNFTPNKDIISGQGTRLKKQSGINLLEPPFNLQLKEEKQLSAITLKEGKGLIITTLYTI